MNPIRTTILLAASICASTADGATTLYNFTTGATATANGTQDSSGKAFQNSLNVTFAGAGTVAFGYFSISDAAITAATAVTTLTGSFNNWNTAGTNVFNAPGPGATGARGTYNFNAAARDLTTLGGDAFAGKFMYAFIGNGLTFAGSTEFLVLKTTFTFNTAESGPTAIVKTITAANSSALFGTAVTNVFTTNADVSPTPGWQTAAIPEPSAAVLCAIGVLGLLRRRRI